MEPESEAEMTDPVPDESAASPAYFGTWQITSSTFGAYSAMSEEACSALVGTCFEYFEDIVLFESHKVPPPQDIILSFYVRGYKLASLSWSHNWQEEDRFIN